MKETREELISLINDFINTPMGTSVSYYVDEYMASHPESSQPQTAEDVLYKHELKLGPSIFYKIIPPEYRKLAVYPAMEEYATQKPQTTESEQEDITNAFCETRDENIKNNLQYRDRDYFQAGYDFAMSTQKHIPTDDQMNQKAIEYGKLKSQHRFGITDYERSEAEIDFLRGYNAAVNELIKNK